MRLRDRASGDLDNCEHCTLKRRALSGPDVQVSGHDGRALDTFQAGGVLSRSLCDDLGRILKAKPLRGSFASLDTSATAKEWQLYRKTGRYRNPQVRMRACKRICKQDAVEQGEKREP